MENYQRSADLSIYLNEDRYKEPKAIHIQVADLLGVDKAENLSEQKSMIDIGGATGEFLFHVRTRNPKMRLVNVEYVADMVGSREKFLAGYGIETVQGDANRLSGISSGEFDFVVTIGVTSIFNDFRPSFSEMIRVAKPGAVCLNCMLLNEEPVDMLIQYLNPKTGQPESGWNKFSMQSVRNFLEAQPRVKKVEFIKHVMPFDVPRRDDPMRSWTRLNEKGERILWNGLNMEISLYHVMFWV